LEWNSLPPRERSDRTNPPIGLFPTCRLPDLREVAVPAKTTGEAARARDAVFDQRLAPVVPLLNQPIAHRKPLALDGGAAVGTDTDLRKARDLLGEFFRLRASTTLGGEVFAQANLQTLVRRHFSSCQDYFQSPALAYDAWQAHGSSIDQGHAPSTAIDAEI